MPDTPLDADPDAWSAGAAGYDASFAAFTGQYSDEALRLTDVGPDTRVLDVAAGSGALTLRAARRGAEVLATDFAPGMVDLLRIRLADEGLEGVNVEVMDGQSLTVADGSFDASFSMFGVIFFPDIAAGVAELARAVRAGGSVCVATWRIESFRIFDLVQGALARALPSFTPGDDEVPWAGIGDADGLGRALADAGLVDVEVHTVERHFRPDDPAELFRRLPEWSPPVQPLFEALDAETIEVAAQAFAELTAELDDDGRGVACDALLGIGRVT